VVEPKDIERLVTAYELTLRALRLKERDDLITRVVAEKIIAIGPLGIEDPAEISKLALSGARIGRHRLLGGAPAPAQPNRSCTGTGRDGGRGQGRSRPPRMAATKIRQAELNRLGHDRHLSQAAGI
jgi:hypothetical protein